MNSLQNMKSCIFHPLKVKGRIGRVLHTYVLRIGRVFHTYVLKQHNHHVCSPFYQPIFKISNQALLLSKFALKRICSSLNYINMTTYTRSSRTFMHHNLTKRQYYLDGIHLYNYGGFKELVIKSHFQRFMTR